MADLEEHEPGLLSLPIIIALSLNPFVFSPPKSIVPHVFGPTPFNRLSLVTFIIIIIIIIICCRWKHRVE
jgi:hypothetical protein